MSSPMDDEERERRAAELVKERGKLQEKIRDMENESSAQSHDLCLAEKRKAEIDEELTRLGF